MKRVTFILCLLLCAYESFGQVRPSDGATEVIRRDSVSTVISSEQSVDTLFRTDIRKDVVIYYRFDRSEIDPTYMSNAETLSYIDEQLTDSTAVAHLDSLSIFVASSPEGPLAYNEQLSKRRSESLRKYLVSRYPKSESKIIMNQASENWVSMRKMVVESTMLPYKDEVMAIIDSDVHLDIKESKLKQLRGGEPWRFIVHNILRYLRYGASAIFYYDLEYVKGITLQPEPVPEPEPEPAPEPEPTPEPIVKPEPVEIIKPLFAAKTNLLFDAATLLNVELEVPIGDRWSVAGEWIFPWWVWDNGKANSKRNRIQLLNGNIEGRYWFGDRENRPVLTGWNLGLYAGGGKYDFERHKKGYQGEFFIAAGLSGGYAHTINKKGNLRMEYTLGIGYLKTDYRYYEALFGMDELWHPIRTLNGNYTWFGPTRARVSFVWLLNYKVKKGE